MTKGLRITVRAKSNGNCIVKADFAGNSTYKPSNGIWSIQISGLDTPAAGSNAIQTITFPALSTREIGPAQKLNATATSGLPITYTSLTPNICYIVNGSSGASVQTVNPLPNANSWDCTVSATQNGDERYAAARPVQRTFRWIPAAMNISISGSTRFRGKGPNLVSATINFIDASKRGTSGLGHLLQVTSLSPITCKVISAELVTISGGLATQAQVSGLANGACQLKFDFAGTNERASSSRSWSTTISQLP